MSVSQTHFQNAHHVEVHNGRFTNIANMTIIKNDAVSTTLWPYVAAGAMFDSAARHAAGKCHPGTRQKIIDKTTTWIDEHDTDKCLLWLYGAAGAGKSALAHTICERLKQSHSDYGGSFFFAYGSTDRGNADKLFATLSYQLAMHFPPMRKEINDSLALDPSLPTKSIEIQLDSLIIQPLLRCQPLLPRSPVLVIDGLDECAETDGSTQSDIVSLIAKYMVQSNPRLRFMIASRPEYWIRDIFETPLLTSITVPLSLRDDVDADGDIAKFLTDGFEKIRVENKRSMGSVVPPWPSAGVINRLVDEASGQYIYAATVLKFVGRSSRFHNPRDQLRIITSSGPHRASAFSEIDALYARILSAYPRWETMKRVLAAHLIYKAIPIFALQTILRINRDEFLMVLDALSALVDIQKKEPPQDSEDVLLEEIFGDMHTGCDTMSFCHWSFGEFLRDQKRSGSFCINLKSDPVPDEILNECFSMISRNLEQKYQVKPFVFLNTTYAMYICMKEMILPSTHSCSLATLHKLFVDMTAAIGRFDPRGVAHMNSLFYFMDDVEYLETIVAAPSDRYLFAQLYNTEQYDRWDELEAIRRKLQEAIKLACRRALSALPLCTDFKATPALVYLLEYNHGELLPRLPLAELSTIAGISDVKSALRQYGCAVAVRYHERSLGWFIVPRSLARVFENGEEPGWRTEGVWGDIRIALAHKCLKAFLDQRRHNTRDHPRVDGLSQFLETRTISDIRSLEYFQNPNNLAILSVITDLALWYHQPFVHDNVKPVEPNWPDKEDVLRSIFHWINRHLKDPRAVSLLVQGYGEAFQETLTTFMNDLFEYIFRQPLLKFCNKTGLCAYRDDSHRGRRPIKIVVRPLPLGLSERILDNSYELYDHNFLYLGHWQRFHDENFGNLEKDGDTPINHIIDPSRWHPHLALGLLKLLVLFCYGLVHPSFSRGRSKEYSDIKSFPYLVQCMPYAHPTPENLDTLRAIVYLYPKLNGRWIPPEGFWALVVEFLHRFDRSILSKEELDLFLKWLNSEDRADINTYVNQ